MPDAVSVMTMCRQTMSSTRRMRGAIPRAAETTWRDLGRVTTARLLMAAAISLVLLGCGAASSAPPSPPPTATGHLLSGKLGFLNGGEHVERTATSCSGTGGYSDISTGAQVTVKDQTGTVIAVGVLVDDPLLAKAYESGLHLGCFFKFDIQVPEATFFTLDIAGRDPVTYSKADLEATKWQIVLTLGT